MRYRAWLPPAAVGGAYGVACALGLGGAADVLVGGQAEPVAAAGGLLLLTLRLLSIAVAPILALGALLGYAFAHAPWRKRPTGDD